MQPSTAVLALALSGGEQLARRRHRGRAVHRSRSADRFIRSRRASTRRVRFPGSRVGREYRATAARKRDQRVHEHCGKVQDAYSLRCAPQVHGATREALAFARRIVQIEANAATDNPMVFAGTDDIVSGGNFHGAPIAMSADLLAAALVPTITISERRTDRLVNPALSGLPAFLTREGGLRSGLMLAQVTAAAVASEMKSLAHPAGVDTIPTSANKEDHVSMSMTAALKAQCAVSRAREVVSIEILCACQAIDLLAPLTTSSALANVHALVRSRVPTLDDDRPPAPDIEAITELVETGQLEDACGGLVK